MTLRVIGILLLLSISYSSFGQRKGSRSDKPSKFTFIGIGMFLDKGDNYIDPAEINYYGIPTILSPYNFSIERLFDNVILHQDDEARSVSKRIIKSYELNVKWGRADNIRTVSEPGYIEQYRYGAESNMFSVEINYKRGWSLNKKHRETLHFLLNYGIKYYHHNTTPAQNRSFPRSANRLGFKLSPELGYYFSLGNFWLKSSLSFDALGLYHDWRKNRNPNIDLNRQIESVFVIDALRPNFQLNLSIPISSDFNRIQGVNYFKKDSKRKR